MAADSERRTVLPTDAKDRKNVPMARGLLDYFPNALAAVAHVSHVGNEQHNPGEELHWAKEKSTDHADCIMRHLVDRGKADKDGVLHSAKLAWRALALLEIEIETHRATPTKTQVLGQAYGMSDPNQQAAIERARVKHQEDMNDGKPCSW